MLRVFGRLASDRPGLDLVLAGDGRLRAELEASVAGTAWPRRVRFAGHVPRATRCRRSIGRRRCSP